MTMHKVEARASRIAGRGLFATAAICTGERVIEYIGERITKEESQRRCSEGNNYIFYVTEEFDLDGSIDANLAGLINHSCAPNTESEVEDERIWIVALRDIEAGEELSFNYGYDPEDFREHPCRCGAPRCVGYILGEEYWPSVVNIRDAFSGPPQEWAGPPPAART